MIHVVQAVPCEILTAIGNLGSLLWQAGVSIAAGLIHGVEGAA
jgi:hypothetical protein